MAIHGLCGEELKAIATKYLKGWLGLQKYVSSSVLFRSKDNFALGLKDFIMLEKKMQVCRIVPVKICVHTKKGESHL